LAAFKESIGEIAEAADGLMIWHPPNRVISLWLTQILPMGESNFPQFEKDHLILYMAIIPH